MFSNSLGVEQAPLELQRELESAHVVAAAAGQARRRQPARSARASAASTSLAVMPRSAMRSGSSQMRIEYSRDAEDATRRRRRGCAHSSSRTLSRRVVGDVDLVVGVVAARRGARRAGGRASACCTVMPLRRTSSGRRGSAAATRFCTSTCALSMSVPTSKVTRERHVAVVGRLRVHVDHALDAVHLLLDDGGDGVGDGLARWRLDRSRADRDGRRHDLGELGEPGSVM